MAQNSRRIAMIDGDSGTLDGSHVPDGILTSIEISCERWSTDTLRSEVDYICMDRGLV
jgi:hypothetical protein